MSDSNQRIHTIILGALCLLALSGLTACGGGSGEPEAAETAAATEHDAMDHDAMEHDAMAADEGAPRVFFANLSDGDEVTSPVHVEFGIENFEIVAAQDPVVVEEGKGHHHLAIDADCKPAGEVIEKAAPWIHFGDGSSSIDVQLPPGPAQLTLQVGDGEHRTLDEEGLCATITVNVVEGEGEAAEGDMAAGEGSA